MSNMTNRQWLLRSRPSGEPTQDDFELVATPVPDPGDGQVLVRSVYLSALDLAAVTCLLLAAELGLL